MKKFLLIVITVLYCAAANAQDVNKIKNKIFENFNKLSIAQELTEEQRQIVYNDVICHMCDSVVLAEDAMLLSLLWRKPILNRAATYARGIKDGNISSSTTTTNNANNQAKGTSASQSIGAGYKQRCLSEAISQLPEDFVKELTKEQQEAIYNEIISPEIDKMLTNYGGRYLADHNITLVAQKARDAAQQAVEDERIRVQNEAKKIQEEQFNVLFGSNIEQDLKTHLDNAISYAQLNDEHFNAKAYQQFAQIAKMYMNGELEHTYQEITPNLRIYGWVDKTGVLYGPARVIRTYKAYYSTYRSTSFDVWYNGVFYAGKPIYGKIEGEDNYDPTMNGFIDISLKATQNNRAFMQYKSLMASMDKSGKVDGLKVGNWVYFMKSGKELAFFSSPNDKEDLATFYNYIKSNQPQSDIKTVQNFEIEPGVIYTGGWKDGAPYGCGATLQQGVLIGDNKKSDGSTERYIISNSRYDETKDSDKGWYSTSIMPHKRLGVCFPKNNNNVGYEFIHTDEAIEMYTFVEKISTSVDTLDGYTGQHKHYLGNYFEISKGGVMRHYFYPFEGSSAPKYTYMGVSPLGSFTIQYRDDNNILKFKKGVKDSYTFEGNKLTEDEYIGVYYDKEQFIYIGHMLLTSDGQMIKHGLGYLIDANDGEIMRQGIWNRNTFTQNQTTKETINAEIAIDINAIIKQYQKLQNASKKKIALETSTSFDFSTVVYERWGKSESYK